MTEEINEKDHKYTYRYEKGHSHSGNWLAKAVYNHLKMRRLQRDIDKSPVNKDQNVINRQLNNVTPKDTVNHNKIEPTFTHADSFKTNYEKDRENADKENKRRDLTSKLVSNAFKTKTSEKTTEAPKTEVTNPLVKKKASEKPLVKPTIKSSVSKKVPLKKETPKIETPKNEKPRVRVKAGSAKVDEDIELISEETLEEAQEISQTGINTNPYGPKPLEPDHNIGFDIWKGNTEREKKIIALMRKNTVKYPDVAGNGNDIYSGARQSRVNFPVAPGQDVKNYNDWFNKGVDPHGLSYEGPFVTEDYDDYSGFYPITHHDLQKNWSVVHTAPVGSKRSNKGTTTIIQHPEGSLHYIHGGELKHDGKGTKDGSGFNVIVHSYNEKSPKGFISNKKSLYGFTKVTNDELNAKEFKTKEHAENHVNLTKGMLPRDCNMTVHPKRDSVKVKTERALHKKASNELVDAIKDATSRGADIDNDMKVRLARTKVRKYKNPNLNW